MNKQMGLDHEARELRGGVQILTGSQVPRGVPQVSVLVLILLNAFSDLTGQDAPSTMLN